LGLRYEDAFVITRIRDEAKLIYGIKPGSEKSQKGWIKIGIIQDQDHTTKTLLFSPLNIVLDTYEVDRQSNASPEVEDFLKGYLNSLGFSKKGI